MIKLKSYIIKMPCGYFAGFYDYIANGNIIRDQGFEDNCGE
jgi:hypothetical protein